MFSISWLNALRIVWLEKLLSLEHLAEFSTQRKPHRSNPLPSPSLSITRPFSALLPVPARFKTFPSTLHGFHWVCLGRSRVAQAPALLHVLALQNGSGRKKK